MKKDSHAIEQLNKAYDSLAWMNLTANLYNLTESIRDGRYGMEKGGLQEELNGIYGQLLTLIRKYADEGNASSSEVAAGVAALREKVVERSEQVQVLCDSLQIYEYLLNRVEYSFSVGEKPFDDEEEARQLLRTIFASEDPTEVNLRIQLMVSQLPVRITKNRFFDLIKDSFSIYENSDVDALKGYQYRIISAAAMQQKPEGEIFSEYTALLDALKELDTDGMSLEECSRWEERIADAGDNLTVDADYLLAVQECINAFYTLSLIDGTYTDADAKLVMLPAIGSIVAYGFSTLAGQNADIEEGPLGPAFHYMEGRLEPLSERVMKDEARVDAYCENDKAYAESEEGRVTMLVKKLMSTSTFAKLSDSMVVMVDKAKLNELTAETLSILESGLKGRSKAYNRCVMASVLKELPVFFNSHTEVMNYVLQSLHNCSNEGEKRGAVAMLWDLLGAQ